MRPRSSRRCRLEGEVEFVEALGSESLVHFTIDAQRVGIPGVVGSTDGQLAARGSGVARVDIRHKPRVGDRIRLEIDLEHVQFFDVDSEQAIW